MRIVLLILSTATPLAPPSPPPRSPAPRTTAPAQKPPTPARLPAYDEQPAAPKPQCCEEHGQPVIVKTVLRGLNKGRESATRAGTFHIPRMSRGDAAAAAWIFRGDDAAAAPRL